jgi:glyoxylase-like metal-dependent hydrolase (beta-lactamase superfamily II)
MSRYGNDVPDCFTAREAPGGGSGNPLESARPTLPAAEALVESFEVPPFGCLCTIVGCRETKEAVVVDPGGDIDVILAKAQHKGLTIRRVLITHGHLDHILGATELKSKLPSVEILMHQDDLTLYENVAGQCRDFGVPPPPGAIPLPKPDAFVADGDVIQWAPSFKVCEGDEACGGGCRPMPTT